jgi:hypothetical protein
MLSMGRHIFNANRAIATHERTTTAKNMGILKYHQTSLIGYERGCMAPGMPGRYYQTKPGLPSGCQVNIKCFYANSTCLGSNYRNISSLTLVQKVIPGYLQRTVDNYSWAYLSVAYFPWSFAWCSPHAMNEEIKSSLLKYNLLRYCHYRNWGFRQRPS